MTAPLKLVETLYETNATDIVGMLRRLADEIERGDYNAKVMSAVLHHVNRDGDDAVEVFSFGYDGGDRFKTAGILHAGINTLFS